MAVSTALLFCIDYRHLSRYEEELLFYDGNTKKPTTKTGKENSKLLRR